MPATPEFRKWALGVLPPDRANRVKSLAPKDQDKYFQSLWDGGGNKKYAATLKVEPEYQPKSMTERAALGLPGKIIGYPLETHENIKSMIETKQGPGSRGGIVERSFLRGVGVVREGEEKPVSRDPVMQIRYQNIISRPKFTWTPQEQALVGKMEQGKIGATQFGKGMGILATMMAPSAKAGAGAGQVAKLGLKQGAAIIGARNIIQPARSKEEFGADVLEAGLQGLIPYAGIKGAEGLGKIVKSVGGVIAPKVADEISEKIRFTADTTKPLEARLATLDELSTVKLPKAQANTLKARRAEIANKRGNELIAKLSNGAEEPAIRAEAFRKLKEQFPDLIDEDVVEIARKVDQGMVDDLTIPPPEPPPKPRGIGKAPPGVIQAAPGATIGAAGNVQAASLEAEADHVESTDPDRAKELRKQAAIYRTAGNLVLGGAAVFGGVKAIGGQKAVAKMFSEFDDEIMDSGADLLSQTPEGRVAMRMLTKGDVRGGVATIMGTEGIPQGFKETLADMVEQGDDAVIKEIVSNKHRLGVAAKRIAKFGSPDNPEEMLAAANAYLGKAAGGGKGSTNDTVERIFLIKNLLKHSQNPDIPRELKMDLLDNATALSAMHFKSGTKAGQQLQVFTLMKRMTPEGLVHWGNKLVNTATNGKKLLSPEAAQELAKIGKEIQDGGNVIDAVGRSKRIVQQEIPPGLWEKVASGRYLAMLSNPSTHVKNMVGNLGLAATRKVEQGIGAGIDKLVSLGTGQRAIIAPRDIQGTKAFGIGLKSGIKNANEGIQNPLMTGAATVAEGGTGASKWDVSGVRPVFEGVPVVGPLEKAVRMGLTAPDEAAFMGAYVNDLVNNIRASAMNAGVDWKPPADFAEQIMPGGVFKPEAVRAILPEEVPLPNWVFESAQTAAEQATLKDSNALSQFASGIREVLAPYGVGVSGARRSGRLGLEATEEQIAKAPKDLNVGHFVLPFSQVPANITMRVVERIPGVGLVDAADILRRSIRDNGTLTQQAQKQMVEAISRTVSGAGMMGMGALLYGLGVVRTRDPDKNIEEIKTDQGWPAGGINVSGLLRGMDAYIRTRDFDAAKEAAAKQDGDQIIKPDSMDPFYTLGYSTVGALEAKERGAIENAFANTLGGVAEGIQERSFLQGLKGIAMETGAKGPLIGPPYSIAKNALGSFVPRPLGRIVSAGQPQVDKKGMTLIQSIGADVAQNIPGLRGMLPVRTTTLGEDRMMGAGSEPLPAAIEGIISPFQRGVIKGDKRLSKELELEEMGRTQQGQFLRLDGRRYTGWDNDKERELQNELKKLKAEWLDQRKGTKSTEQQRDLLDAYLNRKRTELKRQAIRKYKLEPVK